MSYVLMLKVLPSGAILEDLSSSYLFHCDPIIRVRGN